MTEKPKTPEEIAAEKCVQSLGWGLKQANSRIEQLPAENRGELLTQIAAGNFDCLTIEQPPKPPTVESAGGDEDTVDY